MKSDTKPIAQNPSRGMALAILLSLTIGGVFAQETQYISDMVLVPVRSGAGSQFRIVNRGLPSGTALLVFAQNDDGEWTEIETRGGNCSWTKQPVLARSRS